MNNHTQRKGREQFHLQKNKNPVCWKEELRSDCRSFDTSSRQVLYLRKKDGLVTAPSHMKATYILSSLIALQQGFIRGQSGRGGPAHVITQMPQHGCKGLQRNPPGGPRRVGVTPTGSVFFLPVTL